MRQVKLIKTNEGCTFYLKNDDDSQAYTRGEFAVKEQAYRAYPDNDRTRETMFKRDKKVWIKF